MEHLLTEATRLGVAIKYAPLEPPLRGAYIPGQEMILIDQALTAPQRRETLAHELGHALHGHDCSTPRTEAQAWRRAAQLAVDPERYAAAERINPHPSAIALELDLTPRLITEWQRHFGHRHGRIAA